MEESVVLGDSLWVYRETDGLPLEESAWARISIQTLESQGYARMLENTDMWMAVVWAQSWANMPNILDGHPFTLYFASNKERITERFTHRVYAYRLYEKIL